MIQIITKIILFVVSLGGILFTVFYKLNKINYKNTTKIKQIKEEVSKSTLISLKNQFKLRYSESASVRRQLPIFQKNNLIILKL